MDVIDTDFYQPTPKEAQVWKVCDALFAEKKRITYQSIGERLLSLGLKRGSNTDICRYLASWKKHHYPVTNSKTKQFQSKPTSPTSPANPQALQTIANHLQKIFDNQQTISKQLAQTTNPSTSDPKIVELLLDLVKKQQEREKHYIDALQHAREIQNMLRAELEKYKLEARLQEQEP